MRVESYISLSINGSRISLLAKTEEEARKLLELLERYGIEPTIIVASRCG